MKHAPLVALLGVMCALPATAQWITVTKPAAGDTCTKEQVCTIAWTVLGQPGSTGIIELLDKATDTVVRLIKPDVQILSHQYAWTVPGDLAAGQYRVRLRVAWLVVSPPGGVFAIKAKAGLQLQPGPAFKTPVATRKPVLNFPPGLGTPITILYPANMVEWELNHPYTTRWTADTVPDDGFDVDLYTGAGTRVENLLSGAAKPEGPNSWSFEWKPWCNLVEGATYRLRVKSWISGKTATTGPIKMVVRTKKSVENIPVQVENADLYYSNIGSVLSDCSRQIPPGKARAGFDLSMFHGNFSCHVFRSRLTFDLSRFNGKKGDVESAKLITGDFQGCPGNKLTFCGGSLFAASALEAERWKTYQSTATPYPLTGWSAPFNPVGYDVTAAVRDWLKRTKPNFGFVMVGSATGSNCGMGNIDLNDLCVSFFKPIMYVTFIERPDPCGPQ